MVNKRVSPKNKEKLIENVIANHYNMGMFF
jgi:hypothetical protein